MRMNIRHFAIAASLIAVLTPSGAVLRGEDIPISVKNVVRRHQLAAKKEKQKFEKAIRDIELQMLKDLEAEQDRLTTRRAVGPAHATGELVKRVRADGIQKNLMLKGHVLGLETNDALFEDEGAVVQILATSEVGFSIGQVPKGAKIEFQYVSGSWKHFGNVASTNPDSTSPNSNPKDSLAIAVRSQETGRTRVLGLVGRGTKNRPFVWECPADIEEVVLRINDSDGDFSSNPDKNVRYRVRVIVN